MLAETAELELADKLSDDQRNFLAKKISELSQRPNSSLLPRTAEDILKALDSQIVVVCLEDKTPAFVVAFENTGNPDFVEVGMTCNLETSDIHGKDVFPDIIDFYYELKGNTGKMLYLTTTDIRMMLIASEAGFRPLENIHACFPLDVLIFCCNPCSPKKTGVSKAGQQLESCPRFKGDFIVTTGSPCTHHPCKIFARMI